MKILRLCFKNLNSLAGEFEVDFDSGALADAGIFAITGNTGAGKTTILDAVTLALFGKAARYNEERNPANMMSRGTGECFAEVAFECSKGTYLARWDLYRARKKPDGNPQPAKRQLADESGRILETRIANVEKRVSKLTGIDYSSFLRSVLLAQGRFEEFLHAKASERGDLLESITGTEIYSKLSKRCYEVASAKKAEIENARQKLEGVRILSDEEINELSEKEEQAKKKETVIDSDLKLLKTRLEIYSQHNALLKKIQDWEKRREAWQAQAKTFEQEEKRLEAHEKASLFAGHMGIWQTREQKKRRLKEKLQELEVKHNNSRIRAVKELSVAVRACEEINCDLQEKIECVKKEREGLQRQVREIEKQQEKNIKDQELENALKDIRKHGESCRNQERILNDLQKHIKKTEKIIETREKNIAGLEKKKSMAQEKQNKTKEKFEESERSLASASKGKTKEYWSGQYANQEKKRENLIDMHRCQKDFFKQSKDLKKLIKEEREKKVAQAELEADLEKRVRNLQEQKTILEDKQIIYEQTLVIAKLEKNRAQLQDQTPCPLCGSLEHPYAKGNVPSKSKSRQDLEKQKNIVHGLEQNEKETEKKYSSLQGTLKSIAKQIKEGRKYLLELSKLFLQKADPESQKIRVGNQKYLMQRKDEAEKKYRESKLILKNIENLETPRNDWEKKYIKAKGDSKSVVAQLNQTQKDLNEDRGQVVKQNERVKDIEKSVEELLIYFNSLIAKWKTEARNVKDTQNVTELLEKRAEIWRKQGEKKEKSLNRILHNNSELKQIAEKKEGLLAEKDEWEKKKIPFQDITLKAILDIPPKMLEPAARRKVCEKCLTFEHGIKSEIESVRRDYETEAAECSKAGEELLQKVLERGFKNIEQLKKALLPEKVLSDLQKIKADIEKEFTEINALKKEYDPALEKILESEPPDKQEAEKINLLADEREKERTSLIQSMGEIKARREVDEKARAEKNSQIEEIKKLEVNSRKWLVLNDLIGSAGGDKFSRFAQGLTLQKLINLGNAHLKSLNPRYVIQRADFTNPKTELELEILDLYQAEAVRPTRSLSGGESFLVSLSLALGLSELSGSNTRIETLFIDEGFGTLDSQTLDIALAALENLRLQNRTIGVISHVEALKNRIGTQLQVVRQNNGRAKLRIKDI